MNRKLSKEIFIISKGLRLSWGSSADGVPAAANERNRLVMALADGRIGENKRKMWKTSLRCFILDGVLLFSIFIASREVHFAEKIAIFFVRLLSRKFFSKMGREKERLLRVFFIKWREQLLYLWQRRQWMENFWKAFKELSGEGIPKIIFSAREIKNKKCKLENGKCWMCRLPVFMAKSIDGSVIQTIILISNITFDAVRHSDTAIHIEGDLLSCSLHNITNI